MVEAWYGFKVVGIGCAKHVCELLENALFRVEFWPTISPEESFAKCLKSWFNESEKDYRKV